MTKIRFKHTTHWQNLRYLIEILQALEGLKKNEKIEIASEGFATPFQVIPTACVINRKQLSPYVKTNILMSQVI